MILRCCKTGDEIGEGDIIIVETENYPFEFVGIDGDRLMLVDRGMHHKDIGNRWINLRWYIHQKAIKYYPFTNNLP